ncbi:beta-glucosidase [Ameyamaea chiangmaiensis NBRC 103196]|nr:beta-glucosidase [Ameyamaea chiangmaiensis NBRC 103196]
MAQTANGTTAYGVVAPPEALQSAAYLAPNTRLSIPALIETNAGLGISRRYDTGAIALPSGESMAASWSMDTSREAGVMIGDEARRLGFNVLLAGGVNLTRDPRGGRNFEYAGEDPLLAGSIVGAMIDGIQSQHVLSTIKHFAVNDFETSRMLASSNIEEGALRESDLLAFEIGIEIGHPGSVMTSYNRLNDTYTSENSYLLTDTLKHDWKYPGFVMGDWGGTHSTTRAMMAGLDQESAGTAYDSRHFFGEPLKEAVRSKNIPTSRIDDVAHRVLRSMFAVGLFDNPIYRRPLDVSHDRAVALTVAEQGIVLLKNQDSILPLMSGQNVAVFGGHADLGVLEGGGSANVIPIGGNVAPDPGPRVWYGPKTYLPDPPVKWLRQFQEQNKGHVTYDDGADLRRVSDLAAHADVAIVFVTQWSHEGADAASMTLPDHQDALIEQVAHANPHTIVVLENNVIPEMPWLTNIAGLVEAWYPGSAGGEAIARIVDGDVNPSGHLPLTFPVDTSQLPRPEIPGAGFDDAISIQMKQDQNVFYTEGSDVGYRWMERQNLKPQFPFGFGLSYSDFGITQIHANGLQASATALNRSKKDGTTVVQFYVRPPHGTKRLVGWARIFLAGHTSRDVTINIPRRSIARFDTQRHAWRVDAGDYDVYAGLDSSDLPTHTMLHINTTAWLEP